MLEDCWRTDEVMRCKSKVRFDTEYDAQYQIDIVDKTMIAYHCKEHDCWHMGHQSSNPVVRVHEILDSKEEL